MVTRGDDGIGTLTCFGGRPRMPGKQKSMPVKFVRERPQMPSRQVSFNEQVEEWETYEKYTDYFSEYDRRSIHRQRRLSKADVQGIYADLQNLRSELFPAGDCFRDKNAISPGGYEPENTNCAGVDSIVATPPGNGRSGGSGPGPSGGVLSDLAGLLGEIGDEDRSESSSSGTVTRQNSDASWSDF